MKKISALIFDLDGTLVDSADDIADSLNFTIKSFGYPEKSKKVVREIVGDGVKTLLTRATGNTEERFLEKAAELFKNHYFEHCTQSAQLYPGVKELLNHFKEKKMALVSNKPYDMVIKTLKHFSFGPYFKVVLGPESTKEKKPHPEPILKAIEMMAVEPKSVMLVGDGTTDIQAGKSAGVSTCAVTYGYRSREELEKCNPDFFIEKIEELKNIVY